MADAWGVQFESANASYVDLGADYTPTTSAYSRVVFVMAGLGRQQYLSSGQVSSLSARNGFRVETDGTMVHRNGTTNGLTNPATIANGDLVEAIWEWDGTTETITVQGVSSSRSFTNVTSSEINKLGARGVPQTATAFEGTIREFEHRIDGTTVVDLAINDGQGATWTNSGTGIDGVLSGFTDASAAWVLYDDGTAGGGTAQPLTIISAVQNNAAQALTLEQITQLSTITSTQNNTVNTSLIESLQSLGVISANQLNITSALTIENVNALGLISAVQINEAETISLSQSGAQSLSLLSATQVNTSAALSLEQQHALSGLIAQQINESELVDIDGVQAISFIAATQVSEASIIDLDQFTGQVLTLMSAQQVNGAQILMFSQVSEINAISATQINEPETIEILSYSTLDVLTAEQINVASILSISTNTDITSLDGISLVPVTSVYTLTPISTQLTLNHIENNYTLEKQ